MLATILFLSGPASLLAAPNVAPQASVEKLVTPPTAEEKSTGDGEVNMFRVTAGFLVTTGVRYLVGGLATSPWVMSTLATTPALGLAATIGISFLESGLSIAAFQAIAGIKTNQNMVLAFLLSAAASSVLAPLLLGTMGPVGGIVSAFVTNAIRLLLFNLITRKEGESIGIMDLTVSPLMALAEDEDGTGNEKDTASSVTVSPPLDLPVLGGSISELEKLTRLRYQELVESNGSLESEDFQDYLVARRSLDLAIQQQSR